jgi:hypothetical protein
MSLIQCTTYLQFSTRREYPVLYGGLNVENPTAGLDRDDVIIRRRVRQKMELFAEDLSIAEPSEAQLAASLDHIRNTSRPRIA